jgi:hypothetical protein
MGLEKADLPYQGQELAACVEKGPPGDRAF